MTQTDTRKTRRRGGFTLIELLVVIAIMTVLASLLLAAIFRALVVVKQVQTRNEIAQLSAAIAQFQQTFGVDYMPSTFNPSANKQHQFYWNQLFPYSTSAPSVNLQGHQCLVFFLGGFSQQGFNSDPMNPWLQPASGTIPKGPFYAFAANRVLPDPSNTKGSNGGYNDPYGTPYAYFSATNISTGAVDSYNTADCSNLGGVQPYKDPSSNWILPNSFQIISAGADGKFGGATATWPGGPQLQPGPPRMPGYDDISNFATTILGSGQ